MDLELEYYLSVIYHDSSVFEDEKRKLIFMCKKLIELMNYLKESKDEDFVENALIFLLAVCFDHEHDGVFGQKIDLNCCTSQIREDITSILQQELT
ncbi:MAG: hypothetical protein EU539_05810 [Promethearchaeota archaeon]|nr:MAG: hypothetical protein EU539_05810 [Candidatus Lokiarchaeota archaeon]